MDEKQRERFVRWQGRLIEQSSYLNNLLITIGVAIIGFVFAMPDMNAHLSCSETFYIKLGAFLTFLSVIVGISGAISRLFDYRTTLKKINKEIEGAKKTELECLQELYRVYGDLTWFCFYSQTVLLLFGVIVLGCQIFSHYSC